jgi:hypothetical protein
LGIASGLMSRQHDWCRAHGFAKVRTKTLNQWRNMLILNLKHGFEITETYPGTDGKLRIVLEKQL